MRPGISAYLTVYNDVDILPHMLRAIAPYVDELIVVDGSYRWMTPYLELVGTDPLRSSDALYDAIDACGIRYRTVCQIWRDEIEKRIAGYGACGGRYVLRIDADEVPFFDEAELGRFFASGKAVAEMLKPTYISPQWLVALDAAGTLGAEPMLFDRTRIAPDIHLNYLWLVLGPDRLPSAGARPFAVHRPAIGFNAHLNEWRGLEAQIRRGTFYWLHNMRRTGVPWVPRLRDKPLSDVGLLFQTTPPAVFRELVTSSLMLRTQTFRVLGWHSARSSLVRQQEALFSDRFADMQAGRAELNRTIADAGSAFWPGMPISLDLTTRECVEAIAADGAIRLSVSCPVSAVSAKLHLLLPESPWHACSELECEHADGEVVVRLPTAPPPYSCLRREVDISFSAGAESPLQRFRVHR